MLCRNRNASRVLLIDHVPAYGAFALKRNMLVKPFHLACSFIFHFSCNKNTPVAFTRKLSFSGYFSGVSFFQNLHVYLRMILISPSFPGFADTVSPYWFITISIAWMCSGRSSYLIFGLLIEHHRPLAGHSKPKSERLILHRGSPSFQNTMPSISCCDNRFFLLQLHQIPGEAVVGYLHGSSFFAFIFVFLQSIKGICNKFAGSAVSSARGTTRNASIFHSCFKISAVFA